MQRDVCSEITDKETRGEKHENKIKEEGRARKNQHKQKDGSRKINNEEMKL